MRNLGSSQTAPKIPAGRERGRVITAVLLALALALPTGAMIVRIVGAGPISLRLPPTVVTYAHPVFRPLEPYLLFLAAVRKAVPEGAPIRIVASGAPTGDAPMNYLIAVGQLPRHRIRPAASQPVPGEYVAAYAAVPPGNGTVVLRAAAGVLIKSR